MAVNFAPLAIEKLEPEEIAALDAYRVTHQLAGVTHALSQLGTVRIQMREKLRDARKAARSKERKDLDALEDAKCDFEVVLGRIQDLKSLKSSLQSILRGLPG